MANGGPFSNWGSSGGGSSGGGPFSNWGSGGGGGSGVYTPPHTSGGGGGGNFFGGILHAVEQTAPAHFFGGVHDVAQSFWHSPSKTGVGVTQLPHALYAGPETIAKLLWHDIHVGLKLKPGTSAGWDPKKNLEGVWKSIEHPFGGNTQQEVDKSVPAKERGLTGVFSYEYWHDPRSLGGGFAVPVAISYKNKYVSTNVLHHIGQDPLGTLLDATVIAKIGGVAHLKAIERAAAAGRHPGERGAALLAPRVVVVKDFKDSTPMIVPMNHQAATSFGRYAQNWLDVKRFGRPNPETGIVEGGLRGTASIFGHEVKVPLSGMRQVDKARLRVENLLFAQRMQLEAKVRETYQGIPDSQVRAIADVIAEAPRSAHIPDPIQHVIDYREREIAHHEALQRSAKAAGEAAPKGSEPHIVKALQEKVKQLKALDKTAIYADNPKLRAAVEAIRGRQAEITSEAIRRGILTPEQVEQRRFGPQKIMGGGGFVEKHAEGGRIVPDTVKIAEQARARKAMADALAERSKLRRQLKDSWNQVIHHTQTRTLRNLHDEYVKRMRNLGHKAKTFRQYAEEVYPKRTEMGGAVGRALLKQEVLTDAERKANDAYIAARDEWKNRQPPMTASGKGRQHHVIAEPRTVVSAGLRGGPNYEDLSAAEADALQAYAEGRTEGHNPLAQYGPSFRVPHMTSTHNPEGASIYTRARATLHRQGSLGQWKQNKYVLWTRGMVQNDPELFHLDHLKQARWYATEDHFDNWMVPMSGSLDPHLVGGKLPDEFYIHTRHGSTVPRDATLAQSFFESLTYDAEKELSKEQHDYVTGTLPNDLQRLKGETDSQWVARMNEAGIRRVSRDVAAGWRLDTRPSSIFRRMFVRNTVNQTWRFFLLGIKPGWSVANSFTNETLIAFRYSFTKGGGTAFFNSMVDTYGAAKATEIIQDLIKNHSDGVGPISLRQMMMADPRFADIFASEFGHALDDQIQHAGSMSVKWNRSIAARTARILLPYSRDWGPVRLLRGIAEANYRFNIHAENAARAAAVQAEITRVTGKMVRTVEDLQAAMKSMKASDFDKVRAGVLDTVGDYGSLGAFEREWIVTFAPFYPWFKTIMGITAKWVTRHPERLWGLGVMAHAFQQTQNKDYMLGIPLPYFAEDSTPAGPPKQGEQQIWTDRAFNPLVTPIDIINTAKSLTGDPNAQPSDLGLALTGPAFQFLYVAATNRDPFYGGAYSGPLAGTPAPIRAFGSLLQTPQYRTIQQFGGIPGLVPAYKSKVYNTPAGPSAIPGLSEADLLAIEQYWGVPIRYANLQNLKTRGLSEQGHPVRTGGYQPPTTTTSSGSGPFSSWGSGG